MFNEYIYIIFISSEYKMSDTILSFVLSHLPEEWQHSSYKNCSYKIFSLSHSNAEYEKVETYFYGADLRRIERVQNPFQYGRYMLRREMLQTNYEVLYYFSTSYLLFSYCTVYM